MQMKYNIVIWGHQICVFNPCWAYRHKKGLHTRKCTSINGH